MIETKITAIAVSFSLLGLMSPNDQAQTICAAVCGATLGGYMGSYFFPGKVPGHITIRRRWAANLATGTCLGPMAAVWLAPRFPDMPILFLTLAAAGTIGAFGILFLTLLIPYVVRWTQNRLFPTQPPTE